MMIATEGVKSCIHLAEIEITYKCNLNCAHCYNRVDVNKEDMRYENILELMTQLSKENVQKVVITGGEASLHPNFERLCKEIITKRIEKYSGIKKFVLQSNGFIKNISIDILKAFDIIHLSYDISDNGLRYIEPTEIEILAKKLNDAGIYAYLFFTVHKGNIKFIDDIIERVYRKGLNIVFNVCVSTHDLDPSMLLDAQEKVAVFQKLIKYEEQGKIRPVKHPYLAIVRGQKKSKYIGNKGGCTAGIASFIINTRGEMMPCPFLRIPCGDTFKRSIRDVWFDSKVLNEIRDRSQYDKCGDCQYLSYCGGCRASAYNIVKNLKGQDPNCILNAT